MSEKKTLHNVWLIQDKVGCLGKGAFSYVRRKTPHTCDDGSVGIADLIGMKYFEEQKS